MARASIVVLDGYTLKEWCLPVAPMAELAGQTLGIVGLGRVGRAVAQIASSLGMVVIAHGGCSFSRQDDSLDVPQKSLAEVFSAADIVSLHCPLTPQTERMVDAPRLRTMKPTAWLIHTSRGQLVDSQALVDALRAGTLAAAATDVLDCEPPPADHPLLDAPHCLVTPHIAWSAVQSRQRLLETAVANLQSFLAGSPQHVVNR